jgi:hypothetical protein
MTLERRTLLALPALAAACEADRPRMAAGHGPDEGGIGGTGILGVVAPGATAARLVVSGITLEPPAGQLPAAGDVVAVHAVLRDGRLVATRVAPSQPLVGPSRLLDRGRAEVLGTLVHFGPHTRIPFARTLGGGQWVSVSGIWQGDRVLATRIVPAPRRAAAVRGQLHEAAGAFLVGGTPIPAGLLPSPAPVGRFVVAEGRAAVLERVEAVAPPLLVPRPRRIAAVAVVAADGTGPGRHLSGFGLPVEGDSPAAVEPGAPALLLGVLDQRFRIAHGIRLAADGSPADAAAATLLARWIAEG